VQGLYRMHLQLSHLCVGTLPRPVLVYFILHFYLNLLLWFFFFLSPHFEFGHIFFLVYKCFSILSAIRLNPNSEASFK